MSQWSSAKAKRVLAALLRIGWHIKRESGSQRFSHDLAGLMLSSPFMTMMKLVQKC